MGKKFRRQRVRAETRPAEEFQDPRTPATRRHANQLRQRFEILLNLPDPWHEQLIDTFEKFLEAVEPFGLYSADHEAITHETAFWEDDVKHDKKLIKRIRRSFREPVFYRARAYYTTLISACAIPMPTT